jgi:hypothetical protein
MHLNGEFGPELLSAISSDSPVTETSKLFWPNLGHMQLLMPKVETKIEEEGSKQKLALADEKV